VLTVLATALVIAATVALGLWLDRRLGVKPAQLAERSAERQVERVVAGETAAVAIRAKPGQLDRLRDTSRCSHCRAELRAADDEAIRYDDRRLVLLHLTCPACGRKRSLYVEPVT
jgi:uncharacterized protein with PIN domain